MNMEHFPLWALFAAFASACGASQPAPVEPGPAQPAPPLVFTPDACTFPIFKPKPDPDKPEGPVCKAVPYSSEICQSMDWFETQTPVPSGTICLGFQKPRSGTTCADDSDNIECFLKKHPGECNFLQSSAWSPCLNELYLTCIERGDLSGGKPRWVTPPSKIPLPDPERFVTANEICHWYKHTGEWPSVR